MSIATPLLFLAFCLAMIWYYERLLRPRFYIVTIDQQVAKHIIAVMNEQPTTTFQLTIGRSLVRPSRR